MRKGLGTDLGAIIPWFRAPEDKGPTEGNHRLTAITGGLLVPLLTLIFLTGLFMDAWWHIHYAVGFALIPVVLLKLISTGYRALRYYTHNPVYRAASLRIAAIVSALILGIILAVATFNSGVWPARHHGQREGSAVVLRAADRCSVS
ncbi:MAG TPA: hypothetical protein VN837_17015 [Chloroflexota bacterium]|nr:hypothetical protein [Chloroflexota bacterium]